MIEQGRKKLKLLVIDDQLGRDTFRQDRLKELGDPLKVEFSFCSGQTQVDSCLKNEVALALAAVAERGVEAHEWALVLVDMQFVSGRFDDNGVPDGMRGDDVFGARIEAALLERFAGLPVVRFTTLHQKGLPTGAAPPFVSKLGLTTQSLALTLVQHGRIDAATRRALLGVPSGTIFESREMFAVYLQAYQYAQSNGPILILGETGTGKEHLARFIHAVSPRASARFVPVNVAAISSELFEGEMFGSTKGSFTGAAVAKPGLVDEAKGGSLFLDELGDMAVAHQSKVLRFIDTGDFRPVGGTKDVSGQCRILAATSRPVDEWAQNGGERFREDLLQRFTRVLRIPPLRDRLADVRLLAEYAIAAAMRERGTIGIEIDPVTLDAISMARLPGNARELLNGITNAIDAAQNNSLLTIEQFPAAWFAVPSSAASGIDGERQDKMSVGQSHTSSTSISGKSAAAEQGSYDCSLDELVEAMQRFSITPVDPALRGALPKLEAAWSSLRQHLALSALERERHHSGKLMLHPAMQVLMGDSKITPAQSTRLFNSLLDRKGDSAIDQQELQQLVADRFDLREKER